MKKTVVALPDGQIIAIHEVMQGVTRHDYASHGLVYAGTVDDAEIKRGEVGFVWADPSDTLETMKALAVETLDADDLATEDVKASIGKAKKLTSVRAAVEEAVG